MSLIYACPAGGNRWSVFCSTCRRWCFDEDGDVLSDMVLRDIWPKCWECDAENSKVIPAHLYYLDDAFFLTIDGVKFLAAWNSEGYEVMQEDLSMVPYGEIPSPQGGLTPLSSSTYLHGNRGLKR